MLEQFITITVFPLNLSITQLLPTSLPAPIGIISRTSLLLPSFLRFDPTFTVVFIVDCDSAISCFRLKKVSTKHQGNYLKEFVTTNSAPVGKHLQKNTNRKKILKMGGNNVKGLKLMETIYPSENGQSVIPQELLDKEIKKGKIKPDDPNEEKFLDVSYIFVLCYITFT